MRLNDKDEMRRRIVDSAICCILEDGLDEVQLTKIAARVGISARTLHRYYPEKESLLTDAAAEYLGRCYAMFAEVYDRLDKTGRNGLERLILLLTSQKDLCRTDTIMASLFVDVRLYQNRHGYPKQSWNVNGALRIRAIVLDCVNRGKEDGSIRTDVDAQRFTPMLSVSYNGIMQRLPLLSSGNLPEAYRESQMHVFDDYITMLREYLSS